MQLLLRWAALNGGAEQPHRRRVIARFDTLIATDLEVGGSLVSTDGHIGSRCVVTVAEVRGDLIAASLAAATAATLLLFAFP